MACRPAPQDAQENPSFALSYTGSDLTQIDMTVDGVTWRKTLTYVSGDVTAISVWVRQ